MFFWSNILRRGVTREKFNRCPFLLTWISVLGKAVSVEHLLTDGMLCKRKERERERQSSLDEICG